MTVDPTSAAAAYAKIANGAAAPAAAAQESAPSFADLVQGAVEEVVSTGRASEQKMSQAVNGEAPLIDVVTAVTTAEMTLETVTSIRDRMISAYQDVVRMPI